MAREIGYKGFFVAPVLSQALFEDWFMVARYESIGGLFGDFNDITDQALASFFHALLSVLQTLCNKKSYWEFGAVVHMDDYITSAAWAVYRQVKDKKEKYVSTINLLSGMEHIIRFINTHLDKIDGKEDAFDLYAPTDGTLDNTILYHVSESIYAVLSVFANEFEGFDDQFGMTAQRVVSEVVGEFKGDRPDGMNPLQQRVAIKFIKESQAKYGRVLSSANARSPRCNRSLSGPY